MRAGAAFFRRFVDYARAHPEVLVAIENPIMHGHAAKLIGVRQTQVIQPWMFGHLEVKATCLWLFNGLERLTPTDNVKAATMALPYGQRAKVHYMRAGPERSANRSRTLPGVANGMALGWGL